MDGNYHTSFGRINLKISTQIYLYLVRNIGFGQHCFCKEFIVLFMYRLPSSAYSFPLFYLPICQTSLYIDRMYKVVKIFFLEIRISFKNVKLFLCFIQISFNVQLWQYFIDMEGTSLNNYSPNHLITTPFVGHPRLHWVCPIYS